MIMSQRVTSKSLLVAATILASPLLAAGLTPAAAQMAVGISVAIAPPMLPVYVQPPMPADGYIWTPGYWSWSQPVGYYWVPGTWVLPPIIGVLWTPPYWGWSNGVYLFHDGYWGPNVGYYGGVNYGYGYGGRGYDGGRWDNGHFAYNRTVNNFGSLHTPNVYQQNVTVTNHSHVSYVGGAAGLKTEPTAGERVADHDNHVPVTAEQSRHIAAAAAVPALAASRNNGHPAIAATSRPAQFSGPGIVRAQPALVQHPAAAGSVHPAEAHPVAATAAAPRAPQQVAPRPAEAGSAHPAAAHPVAATAAAPRGPEHVAPRPAETAPVRPAEARPVQAAAPRQPAAREAPAEKGKDEKPEH